jgi:hypothetical protein
VVRVVMTQIMDVEELGPMDLRCLCDIQALEKVLGNYGQRSNTVFVTNKIIATEGTIGHGVDDSWSCKQKINQNRNFK